MNRRTTSAIRFAVAALLVLAWGLALLPAAQAQTSGGNLIGHVQDKSGGALPGATVTATQKETGLIRNTVSESNGAFRLPSVPVPFDGPVVCASHHTGAKSRPSWRYSS